MKRAMTYVVTLAAIALLAQTTGSAQRAIIVPRPEPPGRGIPLEVKSLKLDIDIDKQVATVNTDIVFHNQHGRQIEGTFLFPLPESTAIRDFSMYVDGKKLEGEILKKEQAREIYDRIVNSQRDPALLEYLGKDLFQASIFPIPANGDTRVELKYEQLLERDAGLTQITYPLHTTRPNPKAFGELVVDVELGSDIPLKAIYSPTHDIDVNRKTDNAARIGFEGKTVAPDRDFVLYYGTDEREFGASLIAHRERGEDGFLMVLLAPKTQFSENELPSKDVVFVFDTSGSMAGKKIDQARNALVFCLDNLNAADRFNVVTFATGVRTFADGLKRATEDNVEDAIDFAEKMKAVGGTNIDEAVPTALEMLEDAKGPSMVIFLTDGYPTVGETDTDALVTRIGDANDETSRVFTFGVGDEINTQLLDRLTKDNGGAAEYVRPEEDIEVKVSRFYGKVAHPVLTDLEMRFEGVKTYDIYPNKLGDLFAGTELRVLGRYDGEGDAVLHLTGNGPDGKRGFEYEVSMPRRQEAHGFVPRLWAIRKVGYLLDEIRLRGENKELKDEIVQLALTYGIVTPYTSFLVNEDEPVIATAPVETRRAFATAQAEHDRFRAAMPGGMGGYGGLQAGAYSGLANRGAGMMGGGGMAGPAGAPGPAAPAEGLALGRDVVDAMTGEKAVVAAQGIRGMQVNDNELVLDQRVVQNIGRSTFYYDPETDSWTDSRFDERLGIIEIQHNSEAFRQVIMARPAVARYLAQGTRVTYRMGTTNLRVGDTGLTELTADQLQELLR